MNRIIGSIMVLAFLMGASGVALACDKKKDPKCNSTSSANADATAIADVTLVDKSTDINSNVNLNTNTAYGGEGGQGGTGGEGGAGGNAAALAQSQGGQGGAGGSASANASNGDQVVVIDQSGDNISRPPLPQPYIVLPTETPAQQWDEGSWNVGTIEEMAFDEGKVKGQMELIDRSCVFYVDKAPVSKARFVGRLYDPSIEARTDMERIVYKKPPEGSLIGHCNLKATEDFTTDDLKHLLLYKARNGGSDVVEIKSWGGTKLVKATSKSIGGGVTGGGYIGDTGQAVVSGGSGTHMGNSSLEQVYRPYVQANLWRSSAAN